MPQTYLENLKSQLKAMGIDTAPKTMMACFNLLHWIEMSHTDKSNRIQTYLSLQSKFLDKEIQSHYGKKRGRVEYIFINTQNMQFPSANEARNRGHEVSPFKALVRWEKDKAGSINLSHIELLELMASQ